LACLLLVLAGGLGLFAQPVASQDEAGAPRVYVLTFQGAVTPVLERYLEDGIAAAAQANAGALVLQLDTPGGSTDVTQAINQRILAAPVPVIVYVAPSGARAGSAGTFITLAAHAAGMAPGTSIGAASPIDLGGQDIGETLEEKITNILSADIENLAARRGDKAVEWAIAAVRDAAAATADQALALGIVDAVAPNLTDLLDQLDGIEVAVQGNPTTLRTADATQVPLEMGWLQTFLNFIANPTIATLLVTLGTAGLLAEVWNPGTWVPGVTGAIALLLGLYALGQLDANFAGLALMALGVALFVAEAFTPAFGALLVAGMVAFGLGAALLFDEPGIEISWPALIALAAGMGLFVLWASAKGLAAQRAPVLTGSESLLGMVGQARQPIATGQRGSVFVNGEWWTAELTRGTVASGDEVRITGRRGHTLLVEPRGARSGA
jgi:membrane-bound serine protease (ClpP class)